MSGLGTKERPLRVAIIGSGPSGFYAAADLLRQTISVKVDMFEKLPVPFGLVRYGVAPDHIKIKNVTKVFEKIAQDPNFSFLGNVTVGKNITSVELQKYYDAVIFCVGAEVDRRLGILGEDLVGSYTATEFVAWYNGHPDFQDHHFDFSHEVVAIIGQGNVAMDVARILSKTPDELKSTDITQHALEVLAESKIKEVHVYGRRGPVQAAFTSIEIKEMGELADCYPVIDPEDFKLNEASIKELEDPANTGRKKNFEILSHLSELTPNNRKRKFVLHFMRSPHEIFGKGQVQKIRFEINNLVGEPNHQRVKGTGKFEDLDCGTVFRSVGYQGIPIKGVPFSHQLGVIPNKQGRVVDTEDNHVVSGWYVAGWIKRGASGVIGTNKPDSEETVKSLLEDLNHLSPCDNPSTEAVIKLLKDRGVKVVSFDDWRKIDAKEIEQGAALGKPREKFAYVSNMLAVL
jgi:ferredoxin--NADP+ reductase